MLPESENAEEAWQKSCCKKVETQYTAWNAFIFNERFNSFYQWVSTTKKRVDWKPAYLVCGQVDEEVRLGRTHADHQSNVYRMHATRVNNKRISWHNQLLFICYDKILSRKHSPRSNTRNMGKLHLGVTTWRAMRKMRWPLLWIGANPWNSYQTCPHFALMVIKLRKMISNCGWSGRMYVLEWCENAYSHSTRHLMYNKCVSSSCHEMEQSVCQTVAETEEFSSNAFRHIYNSVMLKTKPLNAS